MGLIGMKAKLQIVKKERKWLELKDAMKSSKCQLKFIKKVSFTSDIGCVIIENCHSPEYVI